MARRRLPEPRRPWWLASTEGDHLDLGRWSSSAGQTPRFLLRFGDRQLRGRDRLEALVGDGRSALHRTTVRARREALLSSLDGGELLLEILSPAFVQLVLQKLPRLIARVELTRFGCGVL